MTVHPRLRSVQAYGLCLCLSLAPSSGVRAGDILIGMSAAFQGPSRGLGIELYRGSMAYLEEVNRSGGVHGRSIRIKAYDDGYNPVPAIENTVRLIEQDEVFLLYGYVGTPTVTRALPLLKSYGNRSMYLFFPYTGAQPHREAPYDEFVFNLRASYREETKGLVDNFVRVGRTRIAVFYQIDAYGRSGWDGVRRALARYGLPIVAEATYRRGTPYDASLRPQVDILRRAEPDAVISVGAYAACAAFVRDARDAGWEVPIANVSFVGSLNLLNLLVQTGKANGKDYTTHLINSQVAPSLDDTDLPAVRQYRALMDRYNPKPPAGVADDSYEPFRYSFTSLEGFLNAKLLVEILRRMGPDPRRERIGQVVESIADLDLGIDVPLSFGPNEHQGLHRVYYTTVEGGRFVQVKSWQRWGR